MASLDLVNVQKSFGPVKILHDISIGLTDGEFLVLVGPSGCGKSTLMNIIAGLEEPTAGLLRLEGRDITHVAPADRNISMVFQSYALYPNMTVAKNIEFPLQMRKVEKAQRARARGSRSSKLLQIEHLLERKPRQLSGGQRQRVAIGRALAREPQALSVRRAAVEPRRAAAGRHAHRDQEAAPAPEGDDRLRHARPDRGDDAGHAHRGDEGRRAAAARHAATRSTTGRRTPSSPASWARRA